MRFIRFDYPNTTSVNDFDRLLGTLFSASPHTTGNVCDAFRTVTQRDSVPTDLYEDANHYHVKLELPGVKKENIAVELKDDVLRVTARRGEKEGETSAEFTRRLPVPEGVDTSKVEAAYENGVLTVSLPKLEARKPRQVPVK